MVFQGHFILLFTDLSRLDNTRSANLVETAGHTVSFFPHPKHGHAVVASEGFRMGKGRDEDDWPAAKEPNIYNPASKDDELRE